MKKIMYNVLVVVLFALIAIVLVTGFSKIDNIMSKPVISIVDEEIEDEIMRRSKKVTEESVEFYNEYGTDSVYVLYSVGR